MKKLKVTILVENSVGVASGLVSEWGLSMLLDFGDETILMDTGEQGNIIKNAAIMGVDLQSISRLILSHGHYDHTGGLLELLKFRKAKKLPVYAHPDIFNHYGTGFGTGNYLGVPFSEEQLIGAGAEFIWQRKPLKIREDLWVSGEIPRVTSFESVDSKLTKKVIIDFKQDEVFDDMSLFYTSEAGIVIFCGCAHAGLVNIIEHAKKLTGIDKVRGIVGGTHLGPASTEQKSKTIKYLKSLSSLQFIAPNHCTGLPMASRLANEFPKQFRWANTGATFKL